MILHKEILEGFTNIESEVDQLRSLQGECGELIAAIQNYTRKDKPTAIVDVLNEVVDVYFLIQQIQWYHPTTFSQLCKNKLEKVQKTLEARGGTVRKAKK
jgi:NTP pyrophosphatase (non-canonical NTP hydrolase)